jgi:hypothetical protein
MVCYYKGDDFMFKVPSHLLELSLCKFSLDRLSKDDICKKNIEGYTKEILNMVKEKYEGKDHIDHRDVLVGLHIAALFLMESVIGICMEDAPDEIKHNLAILNLMYVDSGDGDN